MESLDTRPPLHLPAHAQADVAAWLRDAGEAFERGDHSLAIRLAMHAETLAHEIDDRDGLIDALRLLASLHSREGKPEQAIVVGQEALGWMQGDGDPAQRAEVLVDIAASYLELGLNHDALSHLSEAVSAARRAGDSRLLCQAYNRIGLANGQLGRYEEGERFLNDALVLAREQNNAEEVYHALNNLGVLVSTHFDALGERGETALAAQAIARARSFTQEALDVARASGNTYRITVCLSNLGRYRGINGETAAAFDLLDEAYALAIKHGYRALALLCDSNRAEILVHAGRHHQAIPILLVSLERAQDNYSNSLVCDLHRQLYRSYKARGSMPEALAHHEKFHVLVKEQLEQRSNAQSRLLLNRLELDQARFGAERARSEADLLRLRAEQFAIEKASLEAEARELGRRALSDPLTGLGNRRKVDHTLPMLLSHAQHRGESLALAVLDVDHFKGVNDRFGHPVGDAVLKALADILRGALSGADLVARTGGEEFMFALANLPREQALAACERLRRTVETYAWDDIAPGLVLTVSIGLCTDVDRRTADDLVNIADLALYRAKNAGRNRVAAADEPA